MQNSRMRWMVEITDLETDKRLFIDLLKKLNVELYQQDGITYLLSEQFETKATSAEVWKLAEKMRQVIPEVINDLLDINVSFRLCSLYEQQENGSRNRYVFGYGMVETLSLLTATATVTCTEKRSKEEKAKLRAEQLEREHQEKIALVASRILPALQDEYALKIHRLLQQELDAKHMYDIFELIQDDFGKQGKKLTLLATENEWKRFTGSVNNAEVFGDESRHIVLKRKAPKNSMSKQEAKAFISHVADLWLKQKFIDIHNAQG